MTTENSAAEITSTGSDMDASSNASPNYGSEVHAAVEEKLLPQSSVNELVGSVKHKAYQKGIDEATSQWQSELQKIRAELDGLKSSKESSTKSAPKSAETKADASTDNVRDLVSAELQRYQTAEAEKQQQAQMEQYINQTMQQLTPKVQDAAGRYADFDAVTQDADFINEAPELLFYANSVDNAGDVLYNLAKNPSKIGALKSLSPRLAQLEMRKLSESLKQNDSAKHAGSPRAPLSQTRPSNIGGDNGPPSLRDLKAKYARMV